MRLPQIPFESRFCAALECQNNLRGCRRIKSRYDQNLMKTLEGLDLEQPLPTLWPQFDGLRGVPLLIIRGANSDLFSAETLKEMTERHPGAEVHTVEGQGHAPLLLDQETVTRICGFAAKVDGVARGHDS